MRRLLRAAFIAALLLHVLAPITAASDERAPRPKIALVLEGGGAKGFAHVGVLKVLEELNIPIDFVVGTSMGSIVGAAYASGRTIAEMEEVLSSTDWDGLFDESVPRREIHYRLKSGRDRELFGDTKIGIKEGEIVTPLALVQGQNVEPMLQRLFGKSPGSTLFDRLPIPFRAVAADIETGEAVVLDHGSLATAARASMSVPGFFTPVEIEQRLLVDGGIVDNLPVDVALASGADVIIAVECKDHLKPREKLVGPLAISGQILDLLLERSTQAALKLLRPHDIHVQLELREYGSMSFAEAKEIMKLGENEARKSAAKLGTLSVPAAEFLRMHERRTSTEVYTPVIDYIQVVGVTGYQAVEIEQAFKSELHQPLDRKKAEEHLTPFIQTGEYQKISYHVVDDGTRKGLVVRAEPKEWLKNFARIGFALADDFDGGSRYSLALETRLNDVNSLGGYLDIQLEAGRAPLAAVELYQPLATGSRFFVAPEISASQQELLVRDQETIVAEYQREEFVGGMKAGYSLGKYGEITSGLRRGEGSVDRHIGEPALSNFNYDIGEAVARLAVDQLDSTDFPTEGYRFTATGAASRETLGSNSDFEKSSVSASVPVGLGHFTLLLNAEAGFVSEDLPIERYSSLGGFFDISGFEQSSLLASDYWVYRAAGYYRIAESRSPLFPFGGFIGGTLEFASLRSSIDQVKDVPNLFAGSIFVGADTPLLPIYLGYGISDESTSSIYLNIGRLAGRSR